MVYSDVEHRKEITVPEDVIVGQVYQSTSEPTPCEQCQAPVDIDSSRSMIAATRIADLPTSSGARMRYFCNWGCLATYARRVQD
jgi:hypothetical protein